MSSQQQYDSFLRVALVILAAVVAVPLLMMLFTMPMMGMMGWWGGGPGTGVSPVWGVAMVLLPLAALLGFGYLLYRGLAGSRAFRGDRALEELRTSYARGELTDEEYEKRRRLLRDEE